MNESIQNPEGVAEQRIGSNAEGFCRPFSKPLLYHKKIDIALTARFPIAKYSSNSHFFMKPENVNGTNIAKNLCPTHVPIPHYFSAFLSPSILFRFALVPPLPGPNTDRTPIEHRSNNHRYLEGSSRHSRIRDLENSLAKG